MVIDIQRNKEKGEKIQGYAATYVLGIKSHLLVEATYFTSQGDNGVG